MNSFNLAIHSDPDIMSGTPVFIGTRVPLQTLLDYLEAGDPLDEFLEDFPTVSREVALVWIEENRIASYRQQPPPLTQFRPVYCQALYPTAKALFQENRYQQAIAIYQEMHRLQCRQPIAYFLDAAECFLALQQPEDAKRMANYLFSEYAPTLSSSEAERAGDVLFKTGDEDNAGKAYKSALAKLREAY